MTMTRRSSLAVGCMAAGAAFAATSLTQTALAATAKEIDRDAAQSLQSLQTLYRINPVAESISKQARGILVFPKIVKAGLGIGGSYGEGALREGGKTVGNYSSASASFGLQIGAQAYGYAVFFMNDKALQYLKDSKGWEIGVGPTVVVVNEGVAKNLSSTTLKDDAYAFIFGQQGLMAGVSIEGSKVSRIKR